MSTLDSTKKFLSKRLKFFSEKPLKEDIDLKKVFKRFSPEELEQYKKDKEAEEARLRAEEEERRHQEYERRREAERQEVLRNEEKLDQILLLLGFELDPRDNEERHYSQASSSGSNDLGEELFLRAGGYQNKDRIAVSGDYPRYDGQWVQATEYRDGHWVELAMPRITIALSKTPEQAAKDIERRFLPAYRERLKLVKKIIKEKEESRDKTLKNLRDIKGSDVSDWEKQNKEISISSVLGNDSDIYGNIKVGEDHVSMELRYLTPEQTKAILDLLKKEGGKAQETNESLNEGLNLKDISVDLAKKVLELLKKTVGVKEAKKLDLAKVFKRIPKEELEKRQREHAEKLQNFWGLNASRELAEYLGDDPIDWAIGRGAGGEFINIAPDDVKVTVSNGEKEYDVYKSEDDAREAAVEQVQIDLTDQPEVFTPSWLQNYVFISNTDRRVIAGEEADHYMDGEDGDGSEEELDDKRQKKYDEVYEALEDPIGYFVDDMGIYTIEDLLKQPWIQIDTDEAAEDAVGTDGIGHFLGTYDGEQIDLPSGTVAFRVN